MRRIRNTAIFGIAAIFLGVLFYVLPISAGESDEVRGWAWSDHIGWISLNCVTPGTCGSVNYGVDIADTPADFSGSSAYEVTGFGWSPYVGWICFGTTCSGPSPLGDPSAFVDVDDFETHGWAQILSLGSEGWIALNCDNASPPPPDCGQHEVYIDLSSGAVSGFGWAGNNNDTGIGWIDFGYATVGRSETICDDGLDNDSDGPIDCADSDCVGLPGPLGGVCEIETGILCSDGIDNDGDGLTDCADNTPDFANSCWHRDGFGCPSSEAGFCDDPLDNDLDDGVGNYEVTLAGMNCFDADCMFDPVCGTADEAFCGGPSFESQQLCCSDNIDNDGDTPLDCEDSSCADACNGLCDLPGGATCVPGRTECPDFLGVPTECVPQAFPWLEALFHDIYSRESVRATQPPPAGHVNATFCLLTGPGGTVENFITPNPSADCPSPISEDIEFPKVENLYTTPLGQLDIEGLINSRYGEVVVLDPGEWNSVPANLDGRIYYFPNGLTISSSKTFMNGRFRGENGSGVIVVRGSLNINSNLYYETAGTANPLNLASIGWIVFKNGLGGFGDGSVTIASGVTDLVGAFYAEDFISTSGDPRVDPPTGVGTPGLEVKGLMIARQFYFKRAIFSDTRGDERIIFDGRNITNPPPGMSDVTQTLPSFSEVAPR